MKPQSHKPKCWLASLITRERFISLTDWRVVAKVCWISLGEPALCFQSTLQFVKFHYHLAVVIVHANYREPGSTEEPTENKAIIRRFLVKHS